MNSIINNYNMLLQDDKYAQCRNKLFEIEENIHKYEDIMYKEWYNVKELDIFKNQKEYFNYMTSIPRYKNMINMKMRLEKEIKKLDDKIITIDENEFLVI